MGCLAGDEDCWPWKSIATCSASPPAQQTMKTTPLLPIDNLRGASVWACNPRGLIRGLDVEFQPRAVDSQHLTAVVWAHFIDMCLLQTIDAGGLSSF